jgi:hypothetical protein
MPLSFSPLHTFFGHAAPYAVLAAPYMALGALVLSVVALWLQLSLRRRLARLALGRSGSLEETISILTRDTKELQTFRTELEKYLKTAETRLRGSMQGVGVVRFNPFSQTGGGNQSFSVAFLDESESGVVLSTLYARNHVGVYAKPIEAGKSTFELSAEERDAIQKAKHSIASHKKRAGV